MGGKFYPYKYVKTIVYFDLQLIFTIFILIFYVFYYVAKSMMHHDYYANSSKLGWNLNKVIFNIKY